MTGDAAALATVVELVRTAAAAQEGGAEAADQVLDVLRERLHASIAVTSRVDLRSRDSVLEGPDARGERIPTMLQLVRRRAENDRLITMLAGGEHRPLSAQQILGRREWERSELHGFARECFGVTQVATLPLYGSPEEVATTFFGREGAEFTAEELALLTAVQPVVAGLDAMLRHAAGARAAAGPAPDAPRLTARETEVLVLLSRGHTATAIGRLLGCSHRTVHRHLANLYTKLEVRDRLLAVERAREVGLLAPSG